MKKIIRIIFIITMTIILIGCSSTKKEVNNIKETAESTSVSNNEQSELQSKDTSTNIKDIDTKKNLFKKGHYYDYSGTINNNIPIRMSIYSYGKDTDIVGTYYYRNQKDGLELKLKGKAEAKNVILNDKWE